MERVEAEDMSRRTEHQVSPPFDSPHALICYISKLRKAKKTETAKADLKDYLFCLVKVKI